jgi:hypothetical protein
MRHSCGGGDIDAKRKSIEVESGHNSLRSSTKPSSICSEETTNAGQTFLESVSQECVTA